VADDSDDKTEAPTPHRKEKAREEGQVPRSKELTSILMLFVGVGVLWMGGDAFARKLSGIMSSGLRFDHGIINDQKMILGHLIELLKNAVLALLPLVTGVVLVALAAPPVLGGLVLSGKSVQFNFSKINPLSGLKRLFSAQVVAAGQGHHENGPDGQCGRILSVA
jgi:flagellar biosynthetic protein FlhB